MVRLVGVYPVGFVGLLLLGVLSTDVVGIGSNPDPLRRKNCTKVVAWAHPPQGL